MRFNVDENLPVEVQAVLVDAGHDAVTVLDQGLGGRVDAAVAEVCRAEDRALITLDTDFGDIRTYAPADYARIVVLRPQKQDRDRVVDLARQVLEQEPLKGQLWVVEDARVRIRE
ncbi:MAG TPA: DUF5615 family PIN-like protein [Myxococcota bacterium]|nr:DUF5615 family PIN-like protein [Myxococcota bacterium]